MSVIYLDNNATTAVLPQVVAAMGPYFSEYWGNPSSAYRFGASVKDAIELARNQVGQLIGANSTEVTFTSGATEANNTAIHAALATQVDKRHIITSSVEHSSVLGLCQFLERHNIQVTYLPVNGSGQFDLGALESAIRPSTAVVSLMWANNETGVVFPVDAIAAICTRKGVRFHCDAVQAIGKLPINFQAVPIDYLALSGHKIGAPKGIGAIVTRAGVPFEGLLIGGKQESGRRGGTESVPLIVALGTACAAICEQGFAKWQEIALLRDYLEERIFAAIPQAYRNGAIENRLPNTSNFGVPGIDSDGIVAFMDGHDICVSSGAACLEESISPSHVVLAMSGNYQRANEALRVSLGLNTTKSEIDCFVDLLCALVSASR